MKSLSITIIIALIAGYVGGYLGNNNTGNISNNTNRIDTPVIQKQNPFQTQFEKDDLSLHINQLQQKIVSLEEKLNTLSENQQSSGNQSQRKNKTIKHRVTTKKEKLTQSGVSPEIADDLLRRIGQQDFRRLELQNLIQRADSSQRRQYRTELRELNKDKISLRNELGDNTYDQYLFNTNQNNRVSISSIMASSPAESSGLKQDDIILYYDNKKILSWPDLRTATLQGEIGSYTNIEVLRDGETLSLTIPRGTLGVQLDAIQLAPNE